MATYNKKLEEKLPIAHKYTKIIKPLDRSSPGNCIVNNTIWKDIEVYALFNPKTIYDKNKIKFFIENIDNSDEKVRRNVRKNLVRLSDKHSQLYASIGLELERRMGKIKIKKEVLKQHLAKNGEFVSPYFYLKF